MPGGGTKLGTTPNNRPNGDKAICLDVTRLVRRTGRVLTGVDRVEWAYLEWCLGLDRPVYGLMRSAFGYLLLDHGGLRVLHTHVRDASWPNPDLMSRLALKLSPARRGAETALRKVAIARATPARLARMLRKNISGDMLYLNTGHSNLTRRVLGAVKSHGRAQSAVLIHDMIPLTHPEFQRPGTVKAFEKRMRVVSEQADVLICNSAQTLAETQAQFARFGRMPPAIVAHLGVIDPVIGADAPDVPGPYVITVGTIEPRKNHALLLDVWEAWAKDGAPPHLVICGNRGWNNDAVFARLDAMKAAGAPVIEYNGLEDGAMLRLVSGARAALFPSHAEGYGLPQIEAAQLGVPVICGDLDIYREVLGDLPVYVKADDPYSWRNAITQTLQSDSDDRMRADEAKPSFTAPDWDSHFNLVLKEFG